MAKRGENIYKRKDNRWEGRYIKGYNANGNAKYGYCYGKSYKEVKEKVIEARMAWHTRKSIQETSPKKRFSVYCDDWLNANKMRIKESSYIKYRMSLEKHIKPHLGGYPVQQLTSQVIEQFSHELLYSQRLSAKTVKDILVVVHSILRYVSKQFPDTIVPMEFIYPKEPKKEMRVLSREEQRRFMQYLLKNMDSCKFGILLALLTGLRIGEICALRWQDISFNDGTIKVSATMQRLRDFSEDRKTKTKIVITNPKSATSARIIPLTEYALRLCESQSCDNPAAFVLTGEENQFIEPRKLQYHLAQITRDCNLYDVHFHTLRHTFATRCVEVDFEIKTLSEILGHSSPRLTLERYVHSSIQLKRDNMNKLTRIGY